MTDENFDDSQTKLIKHFSNGLTRNLILWIISKEKIHGYGIMKKLDEFFNTTKKLTKMDEHINAILNYYNKEK